MYHLFCVGRKPGYDEWPLSIDFTVCESDADQAKVMYAVIYYTIVLTKLECVITT